MTSRSLRLLPLALLVVASACTPEEPAAGSDAGPQPARDAGTHSVVDAGDVEGAPPPEITVFEAVPPAVRHGESTSVRWEANHSDECTISFRGVSLTEDDEGSLPVEDIQDDVEVALSCQGDGGRANATLTVRVLPTIVSFTATPMAVNAGDTVTFAWETSHAESCELSFGDESYTLAPSEVASGTHDLVAEARGDATLTCHDDEDGTDEATVSVAVARVLTFEATPTAAVLGQEITFSWTYEDITTPCTIDGVDDPVPSDTSATVTLDAPGERTFTLRCGGNPSTTEVSATITVPVLIHSFSGAPSIVGYGGAASLSFGVSNAVTSCDINGVDAPLGLPFASGALTDTTSFVLTCQDDEGRSAVSEPLVVSVRPRIDAFYPTMGESGVALLVWQTSNTVDCSVSEEGGEVLSTGSAGSVALPGDLVGRADFTLRCVSDAGEDEAVSAQAAVWFGTLTVYEDDDLSGLGGIRLVTGSASFNADDSGAVTSSLEEVGGGLGFNVTVGPVGLDLPQLRRLGGPLQVSFSAALAVFAPSLEHVGGDILISNNADLSVIRLPSLRTVGGRVALSDNPDVSSIELFALETVSGDLTITEARPRHLDLTALRTVGEDLHVDVDDLDDFRAPALESVGFGATATGGQLLLWGRAATTTVALDSLQGVNGDLQLFDLGIVALSLPALTSAEAFVVRGGSALESISAPLLSTVGLLVVEDNPALPCWQATDLFCQLDDAELAYDISNNLDGCTVGETPTCP